MPMQQVHGTVGFAMVLKTDSLDVGDFWRLFKRPILRTSRFIQKESQMGGVDGIDYAELFGPETGDPSKNQRGDVMQNGWLRFLVGGMVVGSEILIQR
uniref:Uncharacterized protein n=1 Tax=Romanomermis culicivorax TaxID=13658 RepID=A0A915LBP3_ROMCU